MVQPAYGQFYTMATDRSFPYNVYASQQDSGSLRMASRSPHVGIQERDWQPIFGLVSENSAMVPDPRDPDLCTATSIRRG